MRIVLTRSPAAAGKLEADLQRAGFQVAHVPLTQQVPPDDTAELAAAVTALESGVFSTLLLTSGNTVRALVHQGWSGQVGAQGEIWVVGPGTAQVLNEVIGTQHTWMPQQHSATGILAELPTITGDRTVLLPQSAQARPQLAEGLHERGWQVTTVVAYQTVALNQVSDVEWQDNDVVLITASSAARQWVQRGLSASRVMAMGEPTAATLEQLGRPADIVLAEPTAEALISALRL